MCTGGRCHGPRAVHCPCAPSTGPVAFPLHPRGSHRRCQRPRLHPLTAPPSTPRVTRPFSTYPPISPTPHVTVPTTLTPALTLAVSAPPLATTPPPSTYTTN